jgi:hypothetical protein
MARIPSPLHDKSVPKRVSKPTVTAEAAATVAESAVAPARRSKAAAAKKAAPARKAAPATKKAAPAKAAAAKKAKPAAKAKAPAKAKAAAPAPAAKPAKAHKPKLVRDSFTIPKDEYAVLEALKARALGLGQHVRKSELLRAGIQALNAMDDRALLAAVGAVPTLKTGRPKKG